MYSNVYLINVIMKLGGNMAEIDKKIIEMLQKGVTLQKIKLKFDLCDSDVVKRINALSNMGYSIGRSFNEYGVKFQVSDKIVMPLQDNINITTSNKFTFLVIADTHFGNIYEDLELVNGLYQYAQDRNIRYVFHLGDIIEGCALDNQSPSRIKRADIHEQVDFVTKKYPKSDKVDTIYILGNHDYRCLSKGIDISKVIERRRLDMHFAGFKSSKIRVGDKLVLLQHPFTIEKSSIYDSEIRDLYFKPQFDLILRGHTHHNGIYINEDESIVVNVPACYSSPSRKYQGAYEVEFFNDSVTLRSLILDSEPEVFSEIKYELKPKEKTKTLDSPIDKFNARYSKRNNA